MSASHEEIIKALQGKMKAIEEDKEKERAEREKLRTENEHLRQKFEKHEKEFRALKEASVPEDISVGLGDSQQLLLSARANAISPRHQNPFSSSEQLQTEVAGLSESVRYLAIELNCVKEVQANQGRVDEQVAVSTRKRA